MDLQASFINKLSKTNSDKIIKLINDEIKQINYENITDEIIDKIDLNTVNIYIEFLANDIIEHKFINHNAVKCSRDKLYILLIYYHPKLFEYVFSGKTPDEYDKHRQEMLKLFDDIENKYKGLTTEHTQRLNNVKRLLEMKSYNDILNMTCFEYGYYFTWASFKREFVDISKQQLIKNNNFDVLSLNVRWNNKHDDAIIMYNNVDDVAVPVLDENIINKTKRFNIYPLVETPTGPYSLYDKNMKPIDKLTTDEICVVFNYGNDHYTKLFIGNNEVTKNLANAIIERKIIPNYNKHLLHSITNKDIFLFLPSSCYESKADNKLLIESINKIKKIVMDSFTPNIKTIINNITSHKLFNSVFTNQHDRDIFKLYLTYIYNLDHIDLNTILNICQNYIYESVGGYSVLTT